jgi:hypothetical protein
LCPTVQQLDDRFRSAASAKDHGLTEAQHGVRAGLVRERRDTPDRGDR